MAKQYLKNLDGLRYIAATTVALSHFELTKSYKLPTYINNRFIENAPQIAVTFFFVLSGFLIMWWFLEETDGDFKKIKILKFYRNRISRTWPLYFLIVLVCVAISMADGSFFADTSAGKRFLLYLFFMPNTADELYGKIVYLGQTWSLAVEEFFYVFFPLFLVRIAKANLFKTLVMTAAVFLGISILFNPIFLSLVNKNFSSGKHLHYLSVFFDCYRIYSFLLGAMSAAIIYFDKLQMINLSIPAHKKIVRLTGLIITLLFLFGITFSFLTQQIYSIIFAFLLVVLTYRSYSVAWLNNSFFAMGGKISYGIYMLHMFVVISLINQLAFLFRFENLIVSTIISWLLLSGLIWILSFVSYKYFENPIRKSMRSKFTLKKEQI